MLLMEAWGLDDVLQFCKKVETGLKPRALQLHYAAAWQKGEALRLRKGLPRREAVTRPPQ